MSSYRAITAYYDAEYEHEPMLQFDVPFFLAHLPKRKRLDVLELAAGTGRAAIPIAQAGHRVVGIDYDRAMVRRAKQKRESVGLSEKELQLDVGDALSLDLGRQFDWVCVFFNTLLNFTTLEKLDAVMSTITRHLKPGGGVWIDVFQPNLKILAEAETRDVSPTLFYIPELDRSVLRRCHIVPDPAKQTQRITFDYEWIDTDGVEHHDATTFTLTFMFPRELRLLVERHGLTIHKLYGDHDGQPLGVDSPRMIAWCRKA
jgi:SAM-dependent methyltransferase